MNLSEILNEQNGWKVETVMSENISSTVYLLQNTENEGRRSVLKVLHPRKNDGRFKSIPDNIKVAATCPNMVKISEAGAENGQVYILMPYYHSLYDYQQEHKMTQEEILKAAGDILQALSALHRKGLYHSDVKPENILVDADGTFLLGDPDSVLPISEKAADITREYAAPEAIEGKNVTESSDIYSLALLMYSLLNHGRLPFLPADKQLLTPEQRSQALSRRLSGDKVPVPSEADAAVSAVLCKELSFSPKDRYADAEAFAGALKGAPKVMKKKKGRKTVGIIAAIFAAAVITGGVLYYRAQAPIAKGSCGESATYMLSKDEVLTISGSGTCDTYDALQKYANEVKEIVIEPGITDIGYCAFYMFGMLEKVSLPEGLEVIGGSAFYNCYNLEDVTFPSTLKTIDSCAFTMCQKLTKIELPEGFVSIGDNAFDNCVSVTEVVLPSTLESIGMSAFNALTSLESVDIPSGVSEIGEGAFSSCFVLSEVNCDSEWMDPELYIFVGTPVEGEQ